VEYINVLDDPEQMDVMLKYSKGSRNVPVIVEQETVTIGFNGKS
jgi:glutaredoxin